MSEPAGIRSLRTLAALIGWLAIDEDVLDERVQVVPGIESRCLAADEVLDASMVEVALHLGRRGAELHDKRPVRRKVRGHVRCGGLDTHGCHHNTRSFRSPSNNLQFSYGSRVKVAKEFARRPLTSQSSRWVSKDAAASRSRVSWPSLNEAWTGPRRSRAREVWPCAYQKRASDVAARSSSALACWRWAIA